MGAMTKGDSSIQICCHHIHFFYFLDVTDEMSKVLFMSGFHWNRYATLTGAGGLLSDPLPQGRNPFTNPRCSIISSYSPAKNVQ